LEQLRPSTAHLCLYVGLNKTAQQLRLPKANHWIFPPCYDHDANMAAYLRDDKAPLPLCYISFPGDRDPDFERRYPGKSTIEVIALVPYEAFSRWEGTRWNKRGGDYEEYKARLSERLLEQLYLAEPQVKGALAYHELSTPLTTRHFANFRRGEMYGLAHDPQRFMAPYLRTHTPFRKLYLTGADVLTCGLAGATIGGVIAATAALKRNVAETALKGWS
jgi:all-trans-retinol 13,14-reductase